MDTKARLDNYKRAVLDVDEGIDLLLEGKTIDGAVFSESKDTRLYNENVEEVLSKTLVEFDTDLDISVEEFHTMQSRKWMVPERYENIDIAEYLFDLCETQEQMERVTDEYALFNERGLIPLLRFLLFLVEYMRENKYVWGVGRGSSVSSYILYLLGVHKINSLEHNLDIEEFLK